MSRSDRFDERNLANFLDEEISYLAKDDYIFEYLDERIRDEGRRSETRDNLINFVFDSMNLLIEMRKEPRNIWDGAIQLASYFSAALIKEDRSVRFSDRRQEDEVYSLAASALKLQDALEDYNEDLERVRGRGRDSGRGRDRGRGGRNEYNSGRGRGRGRQEESRGMFEDRDRGRGRGRDRRDDDRHSRGYYEEPSRNERRGRDDDNDSRNRPIDPTRRSAQSSTDLYARRYAKKRESMEQQYEDEYDDIPEPVEETRVPDPRKANRARAYEQVQPEEVTKPSSWNQSKTTTKNGKKTHSSTGKLLVNGLITEEDIRSNKYDLTDLEVVESITQDPRQLRQTGKLAWEVDNVSAEWKIDLKTGYRFMSFRPLSEEEKETVESKIHDLPIYGNEDGRAVFHNKTGRIRDALSNSRYNAAASRAARDEERATYEEVVKSLQEENANLPEDQKKEIPAAPEIADIPQEKLFHSSEVIKGFGMSHIRIKEFSKMAELSADMNGHIHTNFNGFQSEAEDYEPIYTCATVEEATRVLAFMKGTGLLINDSAEVNNILEIHDRVSMASNRIPGPLLSALKRHTVKMVNDILEYEMGTELEIEHFSDLATLYEDVVKMRGVDFANKLGLAFAHHIRNFQLFKRGSDITDAGVSEEVDQRTIYILKRINLVIAPMLANDLRLSFDGAHDNQKKINIFWVNKDSSPKLWDIINKMQFCATSDNIRRNYIWLSDNDWVEVRKDFVDPESESFIIVKHTSA